MKALFLLILFCVLIPMSELAFSKTIARLQLRSSDEGTSAFTQSVFHSFGKDEYVLQIYDREQKNWSSDNNERFELYLGSGIRSKDEITPFGLVARVQRWSNFDVIYSVGFMFNSNRVNRFEETLKLWRARTFVQMFAKTEKSQLGYAELLHYYQVNALIGTKVYVRGYNILHMRDDKLGGDVFQFFADFIYPLHRHWDVYYRWSYVSKESSQLGSRGNITAVGVRFNF